MFKMLGAAVAAIVLSLAGAASAATTFVIAEGTVANGQSATAYYYIPDKAYHSWQVTFLASAPIDRVDFDAWAKKHWHYEYDNPIYDYGDQFDVYLARNFTIFENGFTFRFDLPYDVEYRFDDPEYGYDYWEYWKLTSTWVTARVWPGEGEAATYKVTMTAVPEPGAWALLIIGFGLTGAMIRARRRGYATATCSAPLGR